MFGLVRKYFFSYINENNDAKIFDKALGKSIKSGMIQNTGEDNILIFNSKFQQSYKFIVFKEPIVLEKQLVVHLTKLILKQLELSKIIPTKTGLEKGDYRQRSKGNVESIVSNLVFFKWFYNQDNISVLDMAADIMYRIAVSNHPFTNGNKRTALLSVGAFLDSIGLYLYFYKIRTKTDYLSKWEDFMINIASSREQGLTEDQTLKVIKDKLFESIWMNFSSEVSLHKEIKQNVQKEVSHEELEL
ncbi:MAG: Fic family protein [Spiroplasma sp.]|nr:Fic family protein [Spiroplasma sp.]